MGTLPPIKLAAVSTGDASSITSTDSHHGENTFQSTETDTVGYAAGTSSSAAKQDRRQTRRRLPAAASLDESHRVGPQRRRRMWRATSKATRIA